MTDVAFHFNVPDKLGYTCRLLRKVYASGGPVGVVGAPEALAALDTQLWSFSALDFIPHCLSSAAAPMLAATPIVLAERCADLPPHLAEDGAVLVHLGAEVPAGFERFERLIELVATDDADRAQARTRWRYYAERGYAIRRHDLAAKE